MNIQAQQLIEHLRLQTHPEGGYYRETYRAPLQIQSNQHDGVRAAFTSIYYLLADTQFSAWHRVASDESWFFHAGTDLNIYCLQPMTETTAATLQTIQIGPNAGRFEATIRAGTWFAASPNVRDSFALVSCVVAPGFEFSDFELASQAQLSDAGLSQHPEWPWITTLLAKA